MAGPAAGWARGARHEEQLLPPPPLRRHSGSRSHGQHAADGTELPGPPPVGSTDGGGSSKRSSRRSTRERSSRSASDRDAPRSDAGTSRDTQALLPPPPPRRTSPGQCSLQSGFRSQAAVSMSCPSPDSRRKHIVKLIAKRLQTP